MNFNALESFLRELNNHGFPACELFVGKEGKEIYRGKFGFANAEKTRPVSHTDTYRLFSCTKVATCTAAMRLVEEGKLDINDPVSKYLPAFANVKVLDKETGELHPAQNEMKIWHLFTMTGGLSYDRCEPHFLAAMEKAGEITTLSAVNAMAEMPLLFEPGTHYQYSLCHDVLAGVVETISDEYFSDYVKRIIFDPLGMNDTSFRPNADQIARLSELYVHDPLGSCTVIPNENLYQFGANYDSGGAGFCSTAESYFQLPLTLANNGRTADGYQLLKPETIKMMGVNYLPETPLREFSDHRFFGYGFGLCCRAHMNPAFSLSKSPVGEFGWDGAAASFALVDPVNKISMFFATHVMHSLYAYVVVHPKLRNMLYEALEK